MKTEPLFRGKRVDGMGEVEGGFVETPLGKHSAIIIYSGDAYEQRPEFVEVDPDTVEQIAGDVVEENEQLKEQLQEMQSKPAYDIGFFYGSLAAKRYYEGRCGSAEPNSVCCENLKERFAGDEM